MVLFICLPVRSTPCYTPQNPAKPFLACPCQPRPSLSGQTSLRLAMPSLRCHASPHRTSPFPARHAAPIRAIGGSWPASPRRSSPARCPTVPVLPTPATPVQTMPRRASPCRAPPCQPCQSLPVHASPRLASLAVHSRIRPSLSKPASPNQAPPVLSHPCLSAPAVP